MILVQVHMHNLLFNLRTDTQHIHCLAQSWSMKLIRIPTSYPYSNERPMDAQMRYFADVLLNKPGFGTRCMLDEPLE